MTVKKTAKSNAFPLSHGLKRPRVHDEAHLRFVASLPSVITGQEGCQAAHIRFGSLPHGKRETGASEKPDDCWVLPLTPTEHARQHAGSERKFWRDSGIDPLCVAALLYLASGDEDRGKEIIFGARNIIMWGGR